jgi:predicted ATP-grasp superfamily ATP-dependent carboligase
MLQEWIPGDDAHGVSYHSYFWNGEALLEFTAQGLRKAPPEIGSPRLMLSMEIPEVIEPGRKILQALGYYGFSCTEFKQDSRDGVYKLMEINGRHSMAESLDRRCGINFPWLEYKHLIQGELPSPTSYQNGVYWIHFTTDVAYSLKYRKQERYSLKQYIEPYLRPHTFAILSLQDPRPFFQRGLDAIRRAVEFARSTMRRSRRPDTETENTSLASRD